MRYRHLFDSSDIAVHQVSASKLSSILNSPENQGWYDRLRYLHPSEMQREIHFVHLDGEKVVSTLALQQNPYADDELWLKHVAVDEEYRNRGFARELYQAAIDFARENKKALKRSSPTDLGKKYLSKTVADLKQKNSDVEIRDPDKY